MIGGAKLNKNLRPGPEKSAEFARCALVAAAGAAIATATKASTSQTASHARGEDWRAATKAAASAVIPIATPPQPGTAVNSAALSMVSRMYLRWSAARASMGMGSRLGERSGPAASMKREYQENGVLSSTLCCKVQRRRGRLRWPRIAAQDGVPADRKHVQKHVNAVAEHIHFGSRRMPPPHGNLGRMK